MLIREKTSLNTQVGMGSWDCLDEAKSRGSEDLKTQLNIYSISLMWVVFTVITEESFDLAHSMGNVVNVTINVTWSLPKHLAVLVAFVYSI